MEELLHELARQGLEAEAEQIQTLHSELTGVCARLRIQAIQWAVVLGELPDKRAMAETAIAHTIQVCLSETGLAVANVGAGTGPLKGVRIDPGKNHGPYSDMS